MGKRESCNDAMLFMVGSLLTKYNHINDPLYVNDVKCIMFSDTYTTVITVSVNEHEYLIVLDNPPNPDVYMMTIVS